MRSGTFAPVVLMESAILFRNQYAIISRHLLVVSITARVANAAFRVHATVTIVSPAKPMETVLTFLEKITAN